MEHETVKRDLTELEKAFDEIQMPRPPFVLERMVVGSKMTNEQQYAQCVLELQVAYDNLRLAELKLQEKDLEIAELSPTDSKSEIQKKIKCIEQEQLKRAMLGAVREFEFLYSLWEKFPKKYNRAELNAAQEEEYTLRLKLQASQDLNAHGRVSVGNQEGLRQIGMAPYPTLDAAREVEKRFLESGKCRILFAVATQEKAVKGLPCANGVIYPNGAEVKLFNSWGRKIDDSYNHIVETALADKADYIFTLEDDTFPDKKDILVQLLDLARKNPKCAVGAWYPKREEGMQGVHIVLEDGERQQLKADGKIHEVYTLAMGCSLYPVEMFMQIPFPWFKTTANLSQDSFFSQLAREAGWKLLVDTSLTCKHIDRETGKVFSLHNLPDAMQVPEELNALLEKAAGKKLILEIGTATGGTLSRMMKVAHPEAEFISVDLPGGPFGGEFGQPALETMATWLGPKQKLHVVRGDSKNYQTVQNVEKVIGQRKCDLVFIDGDHSYEGVKSDFEIYKRFAEDLIVFHDIAEHNREDVGVRKFWLELSGNKTEVIKDEKQGWAGIGFLEIKK